MTIWAASDGELRTVPCRKNDGNILSKKSTYGAVSPIEAGEIVPDWQIGSMNLARAFRWQALIDSGTYRNIVDLAATVGKDPAFVARTIRLTLLAPEIVHAILAGTLQRSVPLEKLRKEMPIRWEDQKKLFGVE